jgi:hypothetical protein
MLRTRNFLVDLYTDLDLLIIILVVQSKSFFLLAKKVIFSESK